MDELLREEKRRHSRMMRRREERDDRGNLWARGREMKRRREDRGLGGARCSPHSRIGQSLSPECSYRIHRWKVKPVAHCLLNAELLSLTHLRLRYIHAIQNKHTHAIKKQHFHHDFPFNAPQLTADFNEPFTLSMPCRCARF